MGKRKRASSSNPASKKLNIEETKVSLGTYSQTDNNGALETRKKQQQDYRKRIQQLRMQLSLTRENEVDALHLFPENPVSKKLNIEETKVSLGTYSQTVNNAALETRKKQQQDYRKRIQQLRVQLSMTRENEVDALHLFPEEIWGIILKKIKETDVLRKCVKADPLFKRILSTTQFLFEEVFPFLTGYFSKQDVLSCSHVCSKWRSGVESFLTSYHNGILDTPKSRKLDCFQTELNFNDNYYLNPDVNVIPDSELLLLPGGVLTISKFYQPSPLQMPKFQEWLESNGKKVRHVTLNMKQTSVSVNQLHLICSKLSENCPNLKSLYLSGGQIQTKCKKDRKSLLGKPLKFPSLEFLKVTTQCEKLLEYQHFVLQSCSSHLKYLSVSCWNADIYNKLPWDKLQRLEVLGGNAMQVLQAMEKLEVSHLQKLQFRLDANCQEFTQLFKTINHFPNLQYLSLIFTENCPVWAESKLVQMPIDLLTRNHLETLEVVTKSQKPNRDFLVYFPFVRNLTLRYGSGAASAATFDDKMTHEDSDVVEDFSKDESSEDEFKRRENMQRFGRVGRPAIQYEVTHEDSDFSQDFSTDESSEDELARPMSMEKVGRVERLPIDEKSSGVLLPKRPPILPPKYKYTKPPPPPPKPTRIPEFIAMTRFGKSDNLKDYYRYNIWTVMPLLSKLVLQCVFRQPKGYRGRRPSKRITRCFHLTREGYAWEIEEREQRQEVHAEKVRKEARQLMRARRDAIVKELAKPKETLKKGPKATQLEKQRQILVQEKALSFVIKSLVKSDILTCRLVSKSWKSLADKQFLHEELLARDWIFKDKIRGDGLMYRSSESDKQASKQAASYYKENFDKPFFGRIMQAKLEDVSYCVDKYLIATLKSLAGKIEDLSITSDSQMEPDNFYKICVAILRHCPNLRAVSFYLTKIISSNCSKEDAKERYSKTLEAHHNLESITLMGPRESRDMWSLSPDTLGLIQGYSNLLPQFSKFPNLKHLKFGAAFTEKWIDLLEKMLEAPGLETMGLRLGGDFVTVEQLIKLVNKFPKLTSLDLEFYGKLGGLSNLGIVYTPTFSISTRITAINVIMAKKEEVSLDFLIHFPFLRELCITYGPWAATWDKKDEDDDENSDYDLDSDSGRWEKVKFVTFREPEKDYVQLVQCFGEKKPIQHYKKKILESNIWVVLEKLESLEVVCVSSERDKKHSTVFRKAERGAK